MKGQEALIIALPAMADPGAQKKLIDAAVEAGVRYIMPNECGQNHSNESLCKETIIGLNVLAIREYIERVGQRKTHVSYLWKQNLLRVLNLGDAL